MISTLHAAIARRRREWYASHPEARRRLRRPVISIGNIAAGGRGKTPFAATVARILIELGERPAILSRGYGRTEPADGVVVVRDSEGIRADLARAGDEPFMLARQLPGTVVIASPDRYVGGRLAERHLGATVHLLDDGFQHFQLDRDVDIVLVTRDDVADATTIPLGRLLGRHVKGTLRREPPDVLVAADAIVALDDVDLPGLDMPVFRARRTIGRAVFESSPLPPDAVAIGVAGIADPRPFFESLAAGGWRIASTRAFPDHHAYSRSDVDRIFEEGRRAGASAVLTTEKDFVRLLPYRPFPVHVGWLPLTMEAEPRAEFRQWLAASMASARDIVVI